MKEKIRLDETSRKPSHTSSAEQGPLVLYVEDSEENRAVAAINLGKKFHLMFARNDREACRILTAYGHEIAIVLMDIELKDSQLNGIELTRLIRGFRAREDLPDYAQQVPVLQVPVIFLTAYGNTYQKPRLLLAGGSDMMEKPVDFASLKLAMTKYEICLPRSDEHKKT